MEWCMRSMCHAGLGALKRTRTRVLAGRWDARELLYGSALAHPIDCWHIRMLERWNTFPHSPAFVYANKDAIHRSLQGLHPYTSHVVTCRATCHDYKEEGQCEHPRTEWLCWCADNSIWITTRSRHAGDTRDLC